MSKSFWLRILDCCGLGRLPWAPGTWGSLGGLLVWTLLLRYQLIFVYVGLFILLLILARAALRKARIETDVSNIVIDEFLGMGLALALSDGSWSQILMAFLLFRIFDILKPPGVRYFDRRFFAGWGILLDDLVAGIYAMILIGAWNYYGTAI